MNRLRVAVGAGGVALLFGLTSLGNWAPRAESQVVYVVPGQAVSFRLTGSDPDGDPLTFRVIGAPSRGTVSGSAPDLVYAPSPGFKGRDQLTFMVQDPYGQFDVGLVEFRVERFSSVLRVGPPGPDGTTDPLMSYLASALTAMGVRVWYIVTAPTLCCVVGEVTPFLIGGWKGEPKVLALGPREKPTLVSLSWDRELRLLDVSALSPGNYVIVVVMGTEAVSLPAVVTASREKTQLALGVPAPQRQLP
jgi:hypothetical protein